MKKRITLLSATCLLLTALAAPAASAAKAEIDYVALGDSIASGQTPYSVKVGTGYTDMIAQSLQSKGVLSSFSKQYALSGETSGQFLTKLDQAAVQATVKEAELVTISTGANDVLQFARTGALDQAKAFELLAQIDQNLQAGIAKIKTLNPKVQVYVFGYYFPFPHMQEGAQKNNLKLAFTLFNDQLQATAAEKGAVFINVAPQFESNISYLPNPSDVHPSEAGYQAMANEFLKRWSIASADPFSDIHQLGSKGRAAIIALSEAGIINGKADGTFAPKSNITRAEAAIILARMLGQTSSAPNPGFSDVSPKMKSYQAIAKLTEMGIFSKASKFNPDKLLTRAQMARLLSQALELKAKSSASFSDVSSKHWAKQEIDAVYSHNIMTGGSKSRFYPDSNITREQFALTIYNVKSRVPAGVR